MGAADNKAVFLSYASQDAAAAARLCDALRAAGVEVWFDQNELVGGDAWDAKIRKQIAECALFVPIISANTQARGEGYFRIEWRLAAQRTHAMAEDQAFLLPVVIDETRDAEARVPSEFKAVQWTRFAGGETPGAFCDRVKKLLGGADVVGAALRRDGAGESRREAAPTAKPSPSRPWLLPSLGVVAGVVGLAVWQLWPTGASKPVAGAGKAAATASPVDALIAKARSLLEDDPLRTRRNLELAEQFCLQAIALDQTNAEALAAAAWVNFLFLDENYDDTPQRRADLRRYAEAAALLAPQSVNAQLALSGVLIATGNRPEAVKKLTALAELHPGNFSVLRQLVWASAWRSGTNWEASAEASDPALARLRAHSPMGRAYADSFLCSRLWARGDYATADRVLDGIFAAGNPVRTTYLCRLLILTFGWGDLEKAKAFIATIPEKLLLEDVFICHVATVWSQLGEYDQALATLNRTQRELLHEARIDLPTALLRGNVLAAAGRRNAALVEWRAARQVVERQLQTDPRNTAALENLLQLLVRLGEREAAERQFTLLMEILHPPEGSLAWAQWYDHFVRIGDFDGAVARVDRLIARDNGRWANAYNDLRHEPLLANFRMDPRVQPILARAAGWLEELRAAASAPAGGTAKADASSGLSAVGSATVEGSAKADLSPGLSAVGLARVEGLAKGDKSIAVLAFANLSEDKTSEYFSDGISEELLNVLGRVPGLRVAAPMSSFSFKGKSVTAKEIGQKLNVAYLVNGSVRQAGSEIRVVARLTRAETDEQIWTDKFSGEAKNVFALQDEIAGRIAAALSLELGAATRAARPIDPEAYRLYLEGRKLWDLRALNAMERAEELLLKARQIEPQSALICAGLAELYATRGFYLALLTRPAEDDLVRAAEEAERAIALDPKLAQGYVARATIALARQDYREAERMLRRALALAPNDALAFNRLGDVMIAAGRLDAGLENYRRAMQLDPLSVFMVRDVVRELTFAEEFEEAIAIAKRFEAAAPRAAQLLTAPYYAKVRLGRVEQAAAELKTLLSTLTEDDIPGAGMAELVYYLRAAGLEAESEAVANRLLLRHGPDSYLHALVLMARGRADEALPRLLPFPPGSKDRLYWSPIFSSVREDPRFLRKIEEIGAAAEYRVARDTLARMLKAKEVKR